MIFWALTYTCHGCKYYAQFIDGKWILNGLLDNAYQFKTEENAKSARPLVEKQVKPTLEVEKFKMN